MEKVYVFGIGKFYKDNKKEIEKLYEIEGYIDNRVAKSNVEVMDGKKVINPEDLEKYEEYPILLMTKKFIQPFLQLMALGIDGKRILFGYVLFPSIEREEIFKSSGNLLVRDKQLVYFPNGKKEIVIDTEDTLEDVINQLYREKISKENKYVNVIAGLPDHPVTRDFGTERGMAVDRYYVEKFLNEYKEDISGNVLEIGDNTYTKKYGENRVQNSFILHVMGWGKNAIKGNLETGEGLTENQFDTLILTQTLMFIYGLENVAKNMYKIMKSGATALVTVAGISQISRYDADNWGSYWGFHPDALKKLFGKEFGMDNVEVISYGNVKVATAMLYGLCYEELDENDFSFSDKDYPVILCVRIKK